MMKKGAKPDFWSKKKCEKNFWSKKKVTKINRNLFCQ